MLTMNRWPLLCATLSALVSGTCAAQTPPSTYVGVAAEFNANSSTSLGPQTLSISGLGLDGLGSGGAMALASFGSLGVVADATATPAEAFPTVSASAEARFTDNLLISGAGVHAGKHYVLARAGRRVLRHRRRYLRPPECRLQRYRQPLWAAGALDRRERHKRIELGHDHLGCQHDLADRCRPARRRRSLERRLRRQLRGHAPRLRSRRRPA